MQVTVKLSRQNSVLSSWHCSMFQPPCRDFLHAVSNHFHDWTYGHFWV